MRITDSIIILYAHMHANLSAFRKLGKIFSPPSRAIDTHLLFQKLKPIDVRSIRRLDMSAVFERRKKSAGGFSTRGD